MVPKIFEGMRYKVPNVKGIFTVMGIISWEEAAKTGRVPFRWRREYVGGVEEGSDTWQYGNMPKDYIYVPGR